MGLNDSVHRGEAPRPMDTQQDHPEGHRELQDYTRSEGLSADIEDKIEATFAALSEDLVFYVKTIDNEYRYSSDGSRTRQASGSFSMPAPICHFSASWPDFCPTRRKAIKTKDDDLPDDSTLKKVFETEAEFKVKQRRHI